MWSDDDYDQDYDPWVAADQAEKCAALSNIRISRNKDLTFLAFNEQGEVVGATWGAIVRDADMEENFYDFDVAVHPNYRNAAIGIKLIEAGIAHARQEDVSGILAYVVNPKLIRVLEKRYGFDIQSHYSHGAAHMALRF